MIDYAEMRGVAWRVPPQPQSAAVLPDWILTYFFRGALTFSEDGAHCLDGGWTARPGDWIVKDPPDLDGKPSETIRMISADDVMMGWRIAEYCSHLNAAPETKPMTQYRRNPEAFDAWQVPKRTAGYCLFPDWLSKEVDAERVKFCQENDHAIVHTETGVSYADPDDWIVLADTHALSVVKAEDFARLYSPIKET